MSRHRGGAQSVTRNSPHVQINVTALRSPADVLMYAATAFTTNDIQMLHHSVWVPANTRYSTKGTLMANLAWSFFWHVLLSIAPSQVAFEHFTKNRQSNMTLAYMQKITSPQENHIRVFIMHPNTALYLLPNVNELGHISNPYYNLVG